LTEQRCTESKVRPEANRLLERDDEEPLDDEDHVHPDDVPRIEQLKMELKPMLEENERITGFARAPEVRLQLTDRQPKWVPQYPIVEHHKEIVSEQVQKWLQRGKIRRVSSEWNMPLTTAIKYNKKGEPYGVRVCIDPRVLNTKLVPDNWEIPNIQGLCESFAGMQYYSEIDLEDAFLQLRVRLEDQELLAFTHAGQQYCFVGAPCQHSVRLKNPDHCFTVVGGTFSPLKDYLRTHESDESENQHEETHVRTPEPAHTRERNL